MIIRGEEKGEQRPPPMMALVPILEGATPDNIRRVDRDGALATCRDVDGYLLLLCVAVCPADRYS